MGKFDCIIMNPPYNRTRLHESIIKKVRKYAERIVAIIPAKDGDISLSLFNIKNKIKLKIYCYSADEDFLVEKFTKFPLSGFYISVPKWSKGFKKFLKTGEYRYIKKPYNYEDYITFSFYTQKDLESFKEKLFSQDNAILGRGTICLQYNEILQGINYIKSYRKI